MSIARVHLICPACLNEAKISGARFTESHYKVKCNKCCQRFPIDLKTGENCRVERQSDLASHVNYKLFDPESNQWRVEASHCQGMCYDLQGLAILIKSGLITPMTPIRPPGSGRIYKARELAQLHAAFTDKQRREESVARAKAEEDARIHAAKEAQDDHLDQSWYEMELGEFFAHKLKPALTSGRSKKH